MVLKGSVEAVAAALVVVAGGVVDQPRGVSSMDYTVVDLPSPWRALGRPYENLA